MKIPLTLGYDSQARKDTPLLATVFGYFAAAMAGLARHCVRSNAKHNQNEPVHWARGKSTDHGECSLRHLIDTEEIKAWLRRNPGHPDHAAVLMTLEHEYDARTWRSAADAQEFYEEFRGAPLAFNARLPAPADERVPSIHESMQLADGMGNSVHAPVRVMVEGCPDLVNGGPYLCEMPKGHPGRHRSGVVPGPSGIEMEAGYPGR